MKKFYIVIVLLISFINSYTQTFRITGKVVDASNGNSLSLVSIYIKASNVGTLSNDDGDFSLDSLNSDQTITFSYIGYQTQTLSTKQLTNEIKLVPVATMLSEVIVSSGAREYLDLAYNKILQDSAFTFFADAFFRQKNQVDDKKVNEIKEIFYSVKLNSLGLLGSIYKAGRYAVDKKGIHFNNFSNYSRLIQFNTALLSPKAEEKLIFKIVNKYESDNRSFVDIAYKPKEGNLNEGHLIIDTKSGDIVRYRFTYRPTDKFFDLKIEDPAYSLSNDEKVWVYDCYYTTVDGHTVLEKMKLDLYFSVIKTGAHPNKLHTSSYFFLYNYTTSNKEGSFLTNKFENDNQKIRFTDYDPLFWKNNPMIKRTKLEEDAIEGFEKEDYFKNK